MRLKSVDGDTIDVTIDLGFDLSKKERVRVAGVDTPEKRTRDLEEKELGYDATNCSKRNWRVLSLVTMTLLLGLNLLVASGSMVVFLSVIHRGWTGVAQRTNDYRGYAWEYDGGTKQKNFEELREIRRAHGTLV